MGIVTKKLNTSSQTVIPVSKKVHLVQKVWKPLVNFVPRVELMNELHRLFSGDINYIFISGIGGSGKSELIRKYVSTVDTTYNNICMLDYHGSIRETINQGLFFYTNYSTSAELEQRFSVLTRQEMFCKKMELLNETENCLIVIDNFENIEDENMQQLLDSNAHVIILTREYIKAANVLDITDTMLEKEEIQLFKNHCTLSSLGESVIQKLCKVCANHPMTIILLATLVSLNKYELHVIFEKFQSNRKSIFPDNLLLEKDRSFKNSEIKKHLEAIISLYGLSMQQEQILLDISFAYPYSLSKIDYFSKNYKDVQNDIKLLQALNLIYIEPEILRIHPLLAESILELIKPSINRCRQLLNYFTVKLETCQMDDYYLGVFASKMAIYFNRYDEKYRQLLLKGAKYLFHQSEYHTSIQIYKYILEFLTSDLDYVRVKYQLGLNLKYMGKYQDSVSTYQEIKKVCEDHPDSVPFKKIGILVLIGIANDYHMLGEEEEDNRSKTAYLGSSLDYYKTALHISKHIDGIRSVRCASIYDNIALMYANLKQFKHAYSNSILARRLFRRFKGDESFEMAKCYINLGEIYRLNGKPRDALNSFKIAEQIKKKILPENHDSHIVTFINIGDVLISMKRLDEAEEYFAKAQDIASLKFSRTHIYNSIINKRLASVTLMRKQ